VTLILSSGGSLILGSLQRLGVCSATQPWTDTKWPCWWLKPSFTALVGKYDWLDRAIFLSFLVETPR
jgi:hypothetical protein